MRQCFNDHLANLTAHFRMILSRSVKQLHCKLHRTLVSVPSGRSNGGEKCLRLDLVCLLQGLHGLERERDRRWNSAREQGKIAIATSCSLCHRGLESFMELGKPASVKLREVLLQGGQGAIEKAGTVKLVFIGQPQQCR